MTRSRLVFSLVFIAVGVVLLLDEAGYVSTWSVLADWWPTVLIVSGLAQLVTRPRNAVGSAVLVSVGGVLLLWTLGLVASPALLWPLLLIGLGLWLLTGRPGRGADESAVELVAVFGDRAERLAAGPFRGGSVTTVFGDLDLDLREATLEEGRATLQSTTVVGDVTLHVPPAWQISASGPELLGDVEVHGADEPPARAPVLHLRVLTLLGDVTVRRAVPHSSTEHGSDS